ncbi:MAG: type II toxin-antitoxin system VapC family toxin [Nocardioidaceae bacterium]
MILVDTSIWIDHLHRSEPSLVGALNRSAVVQHPMIAGELALGSLRDRAGVLALLNAMPSVLVATHAEVMEFVEENLLYGCGLGLVDAHLLASVRLTRGASLWTRDKRLAASAERLGIDRFREN